MESQCRIILPAVNRAQTLHVSLFDQGPVTCGCSAPYAQFPIKLRLMAINAVETDPISPSLHEMAASAIVHAANDP